MVHRLKVESCCRLTDLHTGALAQATVSMIAGVVFLLNTYSLDIFEYDVKLIKYGVFGYVTISSLITAVAVWYEFLSVIKAAIFMTIVGFLLLIISMMVDVTLMVKREYGPYYITMEGIFVGGFAVSLIYATAVLNSLYHELKEEFYSQEMDDPDPL